MPPPAALPLPQGTSPRLPESASTTGLPWQEAKTQTTTRRRLPDTFSASPQAAHHKPQRRLSWRRRPGFRKPVQIPEVEAEVSSARSVDGRVAMLGAPLSWARPLRVSLLSASPWRGFRWARTFRGVRGRAGPRRRCRPRGPRAWGWGWGVRGGSGGGISCLAREERETRDFISQVAPRATGSAPSL